MKKIGLFAIAALLTSGIVLGTTSCGKDDEELKDPDTNLPGENDGEHEDEKIELPALPTDKFATKVTLGEDDFNAIISLNETEQTFELSIRGTDGTEIDKNGSYIFEKGFGYSFLFSGENTASSTTYNAETKSHEFKITLKLGDAGEADATLVLKDETFVAAELTDELKFVRGTTFMSNPFELPEKEAPKAAAQPGKPGEGQPGKPGEGQPGGGGQRPQQKPQGVLKIKFLENEFNIYGYTLDEKVALHEFDKNGTYTFENNTFTLKVGEKEYKSTFNLSTREYQIPFEDKLVFKYNPTLGEPTMHGFVNFQGGVNLDLYMFADGTMFGDATTSMKSMNAMFDGRGTWTENEDGSRTLNYKVFNQDKTATVVADPENPGSYKCDYVLTGSEADALVIPLTGKLNKVFELGGAISHGDHSLNLALQFVSDTEAQVIIKGEQGTKKGEKLAYTFADNVITVTQSGKTPCASTYDEATGTYNLPISYFITMGQEMEYKGNLTYCIF